LARVKCTGASLICRPRRDSPSPLPDGFGRDGPARIHRLSGPTFWDGLEGSERLRERIEAQAGVAVTMGSDAARQALRGYGEIRRIGVVTLYMPIADAQGGAARRPQMREPRIDRACRRKRIAGRGVRRPTGPMSTLFLRDRRRGFSNSVPVLCESAHTQPSAL